MDTFNNYENEIKELRKQLKRAERKIKTLESDNKMLVAFNKKATIMRDLSEKELLCAKERAERADQAKGDFLASMSHEIRTPINAVLGMNELIMREASEKNILDYASDIRSSGRMLLSIINDILDFSKIESGKMDIIPVEYDITSVVNDVINMLSKRASDKKLDFNIKIDRDIPSILYGDEIRIRQIITNLLTNAIKYTEKGSVTLVMRSERHDREIDLYIDVADTGKGIREEDQDRLFDSFTRVDERENRTIEGTGLGLALTKGFVDMMGGRLTLTSVYGKGSTFSVKLPQIVINDEPVGDFEERIRNNRNNHVGEEYDIYAPGCRVLVVDDVEMNIKVICGLLKNSGMKIDSALSGFEAIDKCKKNKYDLIFMDHRMPNMDGLECHRELRDNNIIEESTPVIALTANALSGMRDIYINEGFADYLTKPIESRKLESSLHRIIPQYMQDRGQAEAKSPGQQIEIDSSMRQAEDKLSEPQSDTKPAEPQEEASLADIFPELDIEKGLFYCMNSEDFYREMLKEYVNNDRREQIRTSLSDKNYSDFKTYVHGVKSTSLSIGAVTLSEKAKKLEAAAGEADAHFIEENYDEFMQEYSALIEHIIAVKEVL